MDRHRFEFRQEEREDKPKLLAVYDEEPISQLSHCYRVVANQFKWVKKIIITVWEQ